MNKVSIRIAELLEEYRVNKKMNKTAIAKRLGVATSYYSYISTGDIEKMNPLLLNKIAKMIGISTIELFIEFGYIDRDYEIEIGSLLPESDRKVYKKTDSITEARKQGFEMAKLQFSEYLIGMDFNKVNSKYKMK